MRKFIKSGVASLLVVIIVLSFSLPIVAAGQPSKYSTSYNSGQRDVVCTTLGGTSASSYYTGTYTYDNLSSMSSSQLLSALRTLMSSTHKKTTSYDECKSYSDNTDCQNGDGTVVLLYTSYVAKSSDFSGSAPGWNREHVWPKSLGGFNTSGAGADLHHIRPDDVTTNSKRGNHKFGEVSGGTQATGSALVNGMSGGTYNSTYFEPHDKVKGDVARICLYVYARWGGSYSKCSSITNVFQSVDVLLEWCELDPVDTWEMGRNEVVEEIQGNRNVFIDYPELAWTLFGREVPSDMTTPSGEAASSGTHKHSYTSSITKVATCTETGVRTYTCSCGDTYTESIATIPHTYTPSITQSATCTQAGVKTFTCSCGKFYTESISATGHSYTSEVTKQPACTEAGVKTYTCSCGENYTEAISATGHSYSSAIGKQPTCTETGVRVFACLECGDSYIEIISTISHTFVGGVCSSCGESDGSVEEHTHSYSSMVTKNASCTEDGVTTFVCECGDTYTEAIPATGHDHTSSVTKQPSCIEDGVKTFICECGDAYTEAIPATGHSYQDGSCTNCGESESTSTPDDGDTPDGGDTPDDEITEVELDAEMILLMLALGTLDRVLVDELSK